MSLCRENVFKVFLKFFFSCSKTKKIKILTEYHKDEVNLEKTKEILVGLSL